MDKGTPNRPSRRTLFYFISAFWGKKGLTCSALQGLSFMGFPAHGEADTRAAALLWPDGAPASGFSLGWAAMQAAIRAAFPCRALSRVVAQTAAQAFARAGHSDKCLQDARREIA